MSRIQRVYTTIHRVHSDAELQEVHAETRDVSRLLQEFGNITLSIEMSEALRNIYAMARHISDTSATLFEKRKHQARRKRSTFTGDTNILKTWFLANINKPYPTSEEKIELAGECGMTMQQISRWFVNSRQRSKEGRIYRKQQRNPSITML